MSTTLSHIEAIFERSSIKYDTDEEANLIRTIWVRDEAPVTMLLFLLEDGELVQLRAPLLVRVQEDTHKPVVLRAMLQMAYEMRLVQFEYEPDDGEVSTCIDIALEDAELTETQLLRCCSVLLDVSFMARDRLNTILETGQDPGLDAAWLEREEQPSSQADPMVELAKMMQGGGGKA
ncbi:MAG: hypothetical protein ACOC1F_05895 [Myxococcota bacterium]